jgi:lipoyl(octanoyl) transferase
VDQKISNNWHLLHSPAGDAAWNMAVDAALLEAAPSLGSPVLRFYSWAGPAATFGYFQKFAEVERMTLLRPLIRRPTGGGVVPHDADWTYSVVFPPNTAWYELRAVESYRQMHEWIRAAFLALGVATELAPDCRKALAGQCFVGYEKFDVLWQGRKVAGAAQRRTRDGLLIQGSVQPPLLKISRVDWELTMAEVACEKFGVAWTELELDAKLCERATELAARTYSQAEYNQRR